MRVSAAAKLTINNVKLRVLHKGLLDNIFVCVLSNRLQKTL